MKVLVIGIDGASPLLIEKWIENLPTFNKFMERGCWGKSIPPIPAQTSVKRVFVTEVWDATPALPQHHLKQKQWTKSLRN